MPINQYFQNGTRQEQHLYENLIIEAIKIYGQDMYYVPRKIIKKDAIINEDLISVFENAFPIEMYVESTEGFEGDGQLLSKFGLEIRDNVTFVVSNLRWNQLVGRYGYTENSVRPREGDLIYFPLMKKLFEISYVEDKKPFRQLKDIPIFRLTCQLFEYESQELDTGISGIDDIQSQYGDSIEFSYDNETGVFENNEQINFTLPNGVTGSFEFLKYNVDPLSDPPIKKMRVGPPTFNDGEYHELSIGTTLVGTVNGANATISDIITIYNAEASDNNLFINDNFAQNASFSQAVNINDFLDFSEENPFGEPIEF